MDWEPENQLLPQGDARYRVHRSVKCYVAYILCGEGFCALYLDESIERVLHIFPDGLHRIVYKGRFYLLRSPEELEKNVRVNLALKGSVHLLGGSLHSDDRKQNFKPDIFINVTSKEEAENYIRLRPS